MLVRISSKRFDVFLFVRNRFRVAAEAEKRHYKKFARVWKSRPSLPYTWLHSKYFLSLCVLVYKATRRTKKWLLLYWNFQGRNQKKMLTLIWKFDREQVSDLYNRFFLSGLPNNLHQFWRFRVFFYFLNCSLFLSISYFRSMLFRHRFSTRIPYIFVHIEMAAQWYREHNRIEWRFYEGIDECASIELK